MGAEDSRLTVGIERPYRDQGGIGSQIKHLLASYVACRCDHRDTAFVEYTERQNHGIRCKTSHANAIVEVCRNNVGYRTAMPKGVL